jgi:hypothetical protein
MLEDDMGVAAALTALGARAMYRQQFALALDLQTRALELYTGLNDPAAMAYAHNAIGESLRAAGDSSESKRHYQASLALARQAQHERSIAVARSNLASIDMTLGNDSIAREHLVASLPIFIALEDRVNIASCIATLACLDARLESANSRRRAARLFGFASQLMTESHGKFEAADAHEIRKWTDHTREQLDPEEFERLWLEGSSSTLHQIMDDISVTTIRNSNCE